MAGGYSRVTIVGARRRLDTVLPSDEPVGRLLGDVFVLLDEPVARPPRPRQLVTRTGHVLASDATLSGAAVPDGAVLELVGIDDSPPAPVVHDVTEETADALQQRVWRWGPPARRWTISGIVAALAALFAALLRAMQPGRGGVVLLAVVAAGCLLVGALVASLHEPTGTAVLFAGGAVAMLAGWAAGSGRANWHTGERWGLLAVLVCVLLGLLGMATSLGRAGVVGAGYGLALVGLWWAGRLIGLPEPRLAATQACVSIVLIGLSPRLALAVSGLTRVDDRRVGGAEVARLDVDAALVAAHRTLGFAVLASSVSAAVAGWQLAAHADRWCSALAVLLVVILASRARMFPLVGEVLALLGAVGAVLVALARAWVAATSGVSVGMLVAVGAGAVGCVALLAGDPPAHLKAFARRLADRVEAVAVVAALPVAVGVFGVYGRLLHIF